MNLIRYNPWSFPGQLGREADRLFSQHRLSAEEDETAVFNEWLPAIDITEEEDRYLLRADIPGVDAADLDITMDKGVLTLQGKRDTQSSEDREGLRRVERVSGKFYRRFSLPDTADSTAVSADYRQGVLEVSIPKQAEAQPQRIQVKIN